MDRPVPTGRRNIPLLLGVSVVCGFAGTVTSVVAGVWVMSLTGSGSLAGLAGVGVFLPTLVGPVLGVVVDRLPRRSVLIGTCLATAAALLSLLAVRSAGQVWLIFVVVLGYGTALVLQDAGENALLPTAVPARVLGRLNGLRMSAQEGTKLVAPLAGAALFAWAGGHVVALVTAGSWAVAAVLYALVRPNTPGARPDRPARLDERHTVNAVLAEVAAGARFLWSRPDLRAVVLAAAAGMLAAGLGTAVVYAVIDEGLHRPPAFVGVLGSVQGAGSILGGVAAGWVLERWDAATLAGLGALVFAAGPLLHCGPWLAGVLAGSLLVGVGLPWCVVAALTAVQLGTPDHLLGRVAATATSLVFAPTALALLAGAGLLAAVDYRVPLVGAATITVLTGALLLARRSRTSASIKG